MQRKVTLLSFPHGAFSDKHVELAEQAGYERTFSILPLCTYVDSLGFVIGRVKVDPSDWVIEFRLKLLGAYRWLLLAYEVKQKVRSVVGFYPNTMEIQ